MRDSSRDTDRVFNNNINTLFNMKTKLIQTEYYLLLIDEEAEIKTNSEGKKELVGTYIY